jgi:hypothetical protein
MSKYDHKITHTPIGTEGSVGDQNLTVNKDLYIDFFHIPTKKCVSFKGFVTAFDDQYMAGWNSQEVYGRMDPIMTYQGTRRVVSISWDIVAASLEESIANLHRIEHLISLLYPVYNEGEIQTIQAAPLMKIKFANLIRQPGAAGDQPHAGTGGLVSAVESFNYAPTFEPGFFLPGKGRLFPKSVSMQCQFTVLHTHELGWKPGGKSGIIWRSAPNDRFPYGTDRLTGPYSHCPEGKGRPREAAGARNQQKAVQELLTSGVIGPANPNFTIEDILK